MSRKRDNADDVVCGLLVCFHYQLTQIALEVDYKTFVDASLLL